jgi:hypothetical protein
MSAITSPFDESRYPPRLGLTRALLDALALARELANTGEYLRTRTVAERLGLTLNAAYKRIRRLRDAGLLHTQLMWVTDDSGSHPIKVPRKDGKKGIELRSWLVAWPVPPERWGEPDTIDHRFDPRSRKHTWARVRNRKGP